MKPLYESILRSTGTGISSMAVDLGLSVNWGSCNVGANSPEEKGMYFAWRDKKGYKLNEVKPHMFTQKWYENNEDISPENDGATEYLGDDWRMPTLEEFNELNENTIQSLDVVNKVNGIRFTSKKNGNSIFVPFAGFIYNGTFPKRGKFELSLWTSQYNYSLACCIYGDIESGSTGYTRCNKWYGYSIRPVCKK